MGRPLVWGECLRKLYLYERKFAPGRKCQVEGCFSSWIASGMMKKRFWYKNPGFVKTGLKPGETRRPGLGTRKVGYGTRKLGFGTRIMDVKSRNWHNFLNFFDIYLKIYCCWVFGVCLKLLRFDDVCGVFALLQLLLAKLLDGKPLSQPCVVLWWPCARSCCCLRPNG